MKKAVVLNSGGYDSTLVMHMTAEKGYEIHSLFFDYYQKNRHKESYCARYWPVVLSIAYDVPITHHHMNIEIPWATSSLTGNSDDPYMPMRNLIFLSYASSLADQIGAEIIVVGMFKGNNYPDTRPAFRRDFDRLVRRATGARLDVPLAHLNRDQVYSFGYDRYRLHPYHENIWSCDGGGPERCNHCPSCYDPAVAIAKGIIPPTPEGWRG